MATANTIGRICGESPECESSAEESNPLAKIIDALKKAHEMYKKIKEMIEAFKELSGHGEGEEEEGHEGEDEDEDHAPDTNLLRGLDRSSLSVDRARPEVDVEALRENLTRIGAALSARRSMEGPPRPDQRITRELTGRIFEEAMRVSNLPGASTHALDLQNLTTRLTDLSRTAPSPDQAVQAVDNAATMARLRGAKPKVLDVIQKVYDVVKQAMEIAKELKKGDKQCDGAQIKKQG